MDLVIADDDIYNPHTKPKPEQGQQLTLSCIARARRKQGSASASLALLWAAGETQMRNGTKPNIEME